MTAQAQLAPDFFPTTPLTEGIKYAGSKLKLLPYILELARRVNPKTIFDGFSGTTRVSQALAQSGYRVISNDVAAWSKTFATCYLLNPYPPEHYRGLISHLNALPGKDGWFTEHYGGDVNGSKSESGRFIVVEAIDRLLQETRAKHIILSYSSGGRATAQELNETINKAGTLIDAVEVDYKRNVMGGMRWTHKWINEAEQPNKEFLFLIEK